MAELSVEQVLLLNNLMYMTNQAPLQEIAGTEGETVEDYIGRIQTENLEGNQDYGSYMTGDDWKNLIQAVKNDEELMKMQIADTHVSAVEDGVGGGVSAVFVNPDTGEAVVVFRGTGSLEWKDNFVGGGLTDAGDGVSTRCQEEALKWYQSLDLDRYSTVTVTGHSKGGNKAKYITVRDDSVDRCLSFDGQGFSDEFVNKYGDEIARNQEKITNSNVDSDYVNLLLNDIGQTDYYEGFDYGEGGFLENHCPNTFFDFREDGSYQMISGVRDERMEVLDEFLNSYLRSLSPEEKQGMLEMIGELVEGGFNGASANDILDILVDDKNIEYASELIAYTMEYKKQKPELVDTVRSVLQEMGMDNVLETVDIVVEVTEWKYFPLLVDGVGFVADHIPDFVYDLLQKYLETKGITLTKKELKKLAGFFSALGDDMDRVVVKDNGADLRVTAGKKPVEYRMGGGRAAFYIHIPEIRQQEENLREYSGQLLKKAERVRDVIGHLGGAYRDVKVTLTALEGEVRQEAEQCRNMAEVLGEIRKCYETAEKKISGTKLAANF